MRFGSNSHRVLMGEGAVGHVWDLTGTPCLPIIGYGRRMTAETTCRFAYTLANVAKESY